MKKFSLLVASIVAGIYFVNAQTLDQNTHAPAVGDSYSFQYADPASLPPSLGNPGSGNTFGFSGLSIYPGSNTSQGVTVASTGSAAAYPSANVAVQTGTNNIFFNSQSNQLEFYGGSLFVGGYPIMLNYSSPAILGIYPMGLGTTSTGTIAGTIYAMGNNGNFTGTSSFTANATGTLAVPGGMSYANVMRVQTQQNMTFTVSFIQGTLTVNQYDYYAPSYSNFPNPNNNWSLLTVQESTLSSTLGSPSVQTTVTINSNYQILSANNNIKNHDIKINVLPNPVKDILSVEIHGNTAIKNIQIIDVSGKILKETKDKNIDCSSISNGSYFIRIEDKQGKILTEKIIIQH